ncbi:hypothetical protein CY34DRAFT_17239 [Suillus luteus UH-Slu-Lm8-n1]|uniref:Uncharacterized protein n=1 Tax=Suillus luteus UH-Slu-Lm8-n1 TaxID=930992 RepID=A0A0D0A008_9AGAM|nr:hypothetical protein CY34DRAFT_17239 [Suillus luteus UH-Slu-Lm8-n1]
MVSNTPEVSSPSDRQGAVPARVSISTRTRPLHTDKDLPSSPPTSRWLTCTRWRPASIDRDITSHSRSIPTLESVAQEPGIAAGLASPTMALRLPPKATVKRVILKGGDAPLTTHSKSMIPTTDSALDNTTHDSPKNLRNAEGGQGMNVSSDHNNHDTDKSLHIEESAQRPTKTNTDPQNHVTSGTRDNEPSMSDTNYLIARDLLESPQLTKVISLGDPSTYIHEWLINRYHDDPFFKKILDSLAAFKNFEVSNN